MTKAYKNHTYIRETRKYVQRVNKNIPAFRLQVETALIS